MALLTNTDKAIKDNNITKIIHNLYNCLPSTPFVRFGKSKVHISWHALIYNIHVQVISTLAAEFLKTTQFEVAIYV